ncbi:MAG: Flp pilus assembly protein CpaB [Actinobacteria bacterium]|nr:Flp pilus assembly protein CpaB [Actinomycetota bacterium]MCG2807492.1 Flp pilus assembly protein CpaB [Coriobacteriia bacterium]
MRTKIAILIVALVLGGLAAVLAASYLSEARSTIDAESEPIEVLVANEDIPRGLNAEELLAQDLISLQKVPRRFVAAGAISSNKALEGRVLADPLSAGEQVTQGRFELPSTAGLAYSIAGEFVALSIPVDEVQGVSGLVKPGDHVVLYVTFDEDQNSGTPAITKMLVSDTKVLAVGAALRAEPTENTTEGDGGNGVLATTRQDTTQADLNARTMTLAVSTADAERIVFAEEQGKVWCALLPATITEVPVTAGRTMQTIFK